MKPGLIEDNTFQNKKLKNHVVYLDGYRGSLAYWVILSHCYVYAKLDCDYRYFERTGYFIAVNGFFLLSAYLLTHRLLVELNKNDMHSKKVLIIFSKYFIRRFFRVYVPYAIICILIKKVSPIFGGPHDFESYSLFQMLFLNTTTISHLWTIPAEYKYYFFIPLFVYLTNNMFKKNMKILWVVLLVFIVFVIENYSLLVEIDNNGDFVRPSHELLTRFTTFLLGSIVAVLVYLVHNLDLYEKALNFNVFRLFLGIISMVLYINGMMKYSKYYNKDLKIGEHFFGSSLYWSCFLFTFIIGGQNFFTDFFKISLFSQGGKFSYGIYLYHMMVIGYMNQNFRNKISLQFELIVYCFISAFIIGLVSYYLIEKNLIKLANYICSLL